MQFKHQAQNVGLRVNAVTRTGQSPSALPGPRDAEGSGMQESGDAEGSGVQESGDAWAVGCRSPGMQGHRDARTPGQQAQSPSEQPYKAVGQPPGVGRVWAVRGAHEKGRRVLGG